ncbi:hypothetical protein BJX68DRAFT_249006 [Aspergillus pseudodeflectus]|uniref:Secreted protein n=1 Tax=Aspergillus pseudodeflectus TaxID=176178 RepID=A0ABR4JH26_9EURO
MNLIKMLVRAAWPLLTSLLDDLVSGILSALSCPLSSDWPRVHTQLFQAHVEIFTHGSILPPVALANQGTGWVRIAAAKNGEFVSLA